MYGRGNEMSEWMTEKKQNTHVLAGKLFFISEGEYSDYGYAGHFLALVEITPAMFQELIDQCREEERANDDQWDYRASYRFIPNLIRRGWVIDVDVQEIHKGSYGRLDLS
jgi:hypothetical protein